MPQCIRMRACNAAGQVLHSAPELRQRAIKVLGTAATASMLTITPAATESRKACGRWRGNTPTLMSNETMHGAGNTSNILTTVVTAAQVRSM